MSKQNLGRVSIAPKGTWDASTAYKKLDVVNNNGASWLAMQDNTGVTPAESESWMNLIDITKDGVIDALGYTPAEEEGTFQFVTSVTLEEDASIKITDLSLRRCYFEVVLPKNGSAAGSSLVFESRGYEISTWISASGTSPYVQMMQAEMFLCGNYYYLTSTGFGIATNMYPLKTYLNPFSSVRRQTNAPITAIRFGCVCTAGTIARVYGIPW